MKLKNLKICKLVSSFNPIIVTGSQGTGKTTFAVSLALYLLELNPGSEFYHCGLDGATFGTSFEDGTKWHELPDNSVIYIDECDKNGFQSSKSRNIDDLPPHLRALTELRHKGHHLIISTVSVMDIHHYARSKCPGWIDLFRAFGRHQAKATIKPGWKDIKNLPVAERKIYEQRSTTETVYHDRAVQEKFKSSSVHTSAYSIKNIPFLKIFWVFLLFFGALFAIIYPIYSIIVDAPTLSPPKPPTAPSAPASPGAPPVTAPLLPSPSPSAPLPSPAPALAVYQLSITDRAKYAVPAFMQDLDYLTYASLNGYRCALAVFGKKSDCWCYNDNISRIYVRADLCLIHVRTRQYPAIQHTDNKTSVAQVTN